MPSPERLAEANDSPGLATQGMKTTAIAAAAIIVRKSSMRWCALLPRPPEAATDERRDAIAEVHFHEQNAGSGGLTQAVDFRGVKIAKPNDVYTGGTDLLTQASRRGSFMGRMGPSKAARSTSDHPLGTSMQLNVEGQAA